MSKKLIYPDDLDFIVSDIKKYVVDITEEELKSTIIPLLENGVVEPIWDDTFGREVGLHGRVKLKWNNDWEIITDYESLKDIFR